MTYTLSERPSISCVGGKRERKGEGFMNVKEVEKFIKQKGLKPGLRRDISLLGYSVVFAGYKKYLPGLLGFTYEAFGVIRYGNICWSLVNQEDIARKVRPLLNDKRRINVILDQAMGIFKETQSRFKYISGRRINAAGLLDFLTIYERYYGALGVYNAFFRTLTESGSGVAGDLEKRFGEERNMVAALYPKIEKFLELALVDVGREIGVDGEIILNSVFSEARDYLEKKKISSRLVSQVKSRQNHCFYLCDFEGQKEHILSGEQEVEKIFRDVFDRGVSDARGLKGVPAYPGSVKGIVKVLITDFSTAKQDIPDGRVIVAVHTNPEYAALLRKAKAIVTDEGGILSHAAIISRELKIPCVIGTKIATKVLKDGDLVEVNANDGIVKIIKKSDGK
jgi:phosphohistidine swiveling domain-containing protein